MADARSRPPLIDWDRVRSGAIPWTSDGYMEVLNFKQTLRVTPKDDWDLTRYRFAVEFSEGVVRGFELNPLMYEHQIGLFIKKRYADEGVMIIAAHRLRYFEMNWFLSKHRKRFEREGFIRKSEESGKIEVNDCLFKALAEARLVRTRGKSKHKHPTFDLAAVVARTKTLIDEEERD